MGIKRKRLQSSSRISDAKTSNEKRKQKKLANNEDSMNTAASSSQSHFAMENIKQENVGESSECVENIKQENVDESSEYNSNMTHATGSICNSKISQLKLMAIASGDVLRMRDSDDLWTRSRSLLRKNTNDTLKNKSQSEYHRNNFHLSLKDKWSKVMTNKISALAFSRSLKGQRHSEAICGS